MKVRHFDRIANGGLDFTELGFGAAPLGNLYGPVADDDAHAFWRQRGPPASGITTPHRAMGWNCPKFA